MNPGEAPPGGDLFRMVVTGDTCITRRLSAYSGIEFQGLVELIRGADVAATNLEMLFHDFESPPMVEAQGEHFRGDPALAQELAWIGLNMVSLANNHTWDYGPEALCRTLQVVREAGIVPAGAGLSLDEAREAKFLDTARGRVALVAVSVTFPSFSRAGRGGGGILPRPGVNALRSSSRLVLLRPAFEELRKLLRGMGVEMAETEDSLALPPGPPVCVGEESWLQTELLQPDLEEVTAAVSSATRRADYTIASLHAHEGPDFFTPARFVVETAHALVVAGADVVMGHGPHVLRGVEIYRGRPIFYSLGEFIFHFDAHLRYPEETFELFRLGPEAQAADVIEDPQQIAPFRKWPEAWESVVPVLSFRGKELVSVELHPISLGYRQSWTMRGRPVLPTKEHAETILGKLARLSQPFGTRIELRDGIGTIQLSLPACPPNVRT